MGSSAANSPPFRKTSTLPRTSRTRRSWRGSPFARIESGMSERSRTRRTSALPVAEPGPAAAEAGANGSARARVATMMKASAATTASAEAAGRGVCAIDGGLFIGRLAIIPCVLAERQREPGEAGMDRVDFHAMNRVNHALSVLGPLDLDLTFTCGQAFRWRRVAGDWSGVIGHAEVVARRDRGGGLAVEVRGEDPGEESIRRYLRLDEHPRVHLEHAE